MTAPRADEAARSVLTLFGTRALGLPGTHLARTSRPGRVHRDWHYWWQAHLLDCMVDAHGRGSPVVSERLIRRHLRGIRVRNWGRLRNGFYDDMAWLALAAHRAGRPARGLERALRGAITDDWGGGAYWSTDRDFKNTAATAPIALYLARTGDRVAAGRLLDWLLAHLADPDTGLLRDGLRRVDGRPTLVPHVFTYNQGPVLAVMLELGRVDDATRLLGAIGTRLTHPGTAVLRTHGGGDGGLFTGILARYLALAARDPRIPADARAAAAELVVTTAEALWAGREVRGWRHRPVTVFPQDTTPAGAGPVADTVELAAQLQAWLALEAAAVLRRSA